jgi:hypothetical protein
MLRHIEGPADIHTRLDSSMRPGCGCETSDFTEDEYREVRVVVDGNYKRKMVASLDKLFLEPQNWRQSAPVYVGQQPTRECISLATTVANAWLVSCIGC